MIDFIEYVVSELKSKRLNKSNALSLIKQFSRNSSATASASIIHPLLHTNTSDLGQQSYRSTFSGEEFFLADHQVKMGSAAQAKVLPGVAYLEMARAAIAQALPELPEDAILELRNTVWAQPVVVNKLKSVNIALIETETGAIDYEIYSDVDGQEVIHCQGQAVFTSQVAPDAVDLDSLSAQMQRGMLDADTVYKAFVKTGLNYGPAHKGIVEIKQGEGELVAKLRLPSSIADTENDYVLHPSLMDCALQASIGLVDDLAKFADKPSLPFALSSIRVIAPCTADMTAWVRYTPGSENQDKVSKVDLDLYDANGNVCVQIQGFTSRVLDISPADLTAGSGDTLGILHASSVWKDAASIHGETQEETHAETQNYLQKHILICELPNVDAKALAGRTDAKCDDISADAKQGIDTRYQTYALAAFEKIQKIFQNKPNGRVLFQLVLPDNQDGAILAGFSGLLKSAALENNHFVGQIVLSNAAVKTDALAAQLQIAANNPQDPEIKFIGDKSNSKRQVLRWEEQTVSDINVPQSTHVPFKDSGVYLITGGLGGLGILFAKDIIKQTKNAKIILTGRSSLTAQRRTDLKKLQDLAASNGSNGVVEYEQLDIADSAQVQALVKDIVSKHKQLNGVIHSAGVIYDSFIMRKTSEDFAKVMSPKVTGTVNLDLATQDLDIDFIVLFSALAGAMGNWGQSDYATANNFMDHYAALRNKWASEGKRSGHTLAIDWPLWNDGGMKVDKAAQDNLRKTSGMVPMQAATGINAFYQGLAEQSAQLLVMEGDLAHMREVVFAEPKLQVPEPVVDVPVETTVAAAKAAPVKAAKPAGNLVDKMQDYLRKQFSELLKMPAHKIDAQAPLEQYGIDSILAMNLTSELEKTFGSLSKTLFFEYQTLTELTDYLIGAFPAELDKLFGSASQEKAQAKPAPAVAKEAAPLATATPAASGRRGGRRMHRGAALIQGGQTGQFGSKSAFQAEPVAIVGMSGRYPEAWDLEDYWHNLRDGKDCITEVPSDRWDWREYYTDDRTQEGHHFSKWGGFIKGIDEFDPVFFNIIPREAEALDPQERLFLQHAWMAIEDAGYTRAGLRVHRDDDLDGQVGVYVGLMYSEYQLFGPQAAINGKRIGVAGSYASIANRVSYVMNLHGPSMTVDTMCSSSITSIHLACQDLKQGRTDMAIAGGVNLTIHPSKYLILSDWQFISGDGNCQSFGEGGDGYIPGEGVGAVVLKRLSEAERDGNHIYGVIRGSSLNHGGKTNGYSVPNPQAQASVISHALKEANINPRHISYIEAHGTGTKLGDPIEIAALKKVFEEYTQEKQFCLIGSAKSNIGHCESAAGIAGVAKVLLQMQYKQIVPSLHSSTLNPHINFENSPFTVNQVLRPWEQPVVDGKTLPRIAGISSFGAGGSNAHILIEEYTPKTAQSHSEMLADEFDTVIVPISARTEEQLMQKVKDLLAFISKAEQREKETGIKLDLLSLAYTLQVGREPMEERFGLMVSSIEELAKRLQAFVDGEQEIDDAYRGQVKRNKDGMLLISQDDDMKEAIDRWLERRKYTKLLDLWAKGLDVDWDKLYGDIKPNRVSLPTYPFAKLRYWVDIGSATNVDAAGLYKASGLNKASVLHPMLHTNTSDFTQQSYRSNFNGNEFFLSDHQVETSAGAQAKVLPAVAYLEMVRAAVEQALPQAFMSEGGVIELHNTAWAQPLIVSGSKQVTVALEASDSDSIDYQITSLDNQQEALHCQGQAVLTAVSQPLQLDLAQLKGLMQRGSIAPEQFYPAFSNMGIHYGAAYQGVAAIYQGQQQLLAQLHIPAASENSLNDFVLHPSLLDSALQSTLGLVEDFANIPDQPTLPFALDSIRILGSCSTDMYAWIRYSEGSHPGDSVIKLDIDLCDDQGYVVAQLRGFTSRVMDNMASASASGQGSLLAKPEWKSRVASGVAAKAASRDSFAQHHIVLCDMPRVTDKQVASAIDGAQVIELKDKQKDIATRYRDYALHVFSTIKEIFTKQAQDQVKEKVLLQIFAPAKAAKTPQEQSVFAGLAALLKTASMENPNLVGQIILSDAQSAKVVSEHVESALSNVADVAVKFIGKSSEVMGWNITDTTDDAPEAVFKDNGVYLITGGTGGLGLVFAKEILAQTNAATVVLTGRGELSDDKQAQLDEIQQASGSQSKLEYAQLDIASLDAVKKLIAQVQQNHGALNGILHSAGMLADNFIVKKSAEDFAKVQEPKVIGTYNLDEASKELDLDFLALFSSFSGAFGNAAQADYSSANSFMDNYAAYRNQLVAAGQRHGHTLSVNWPLWADGGMTVDETSIDMMQQATGMIPMDNATGMKAFYRALADSYDQALIVEGNVNKMRSVLFGEKLVEATAEAKVETPVAKPVSTPAPVAKQVQAQPVQTAPVAQTSGTAPETSLVNQVQDYLKQQFSDLLKLPAYEIDSKAALEDYGIDSILSMRLTTLLEKTFGSLSKTLFFEYQTIQALAGYLLKAFPDVVQREVGQTAQAQATSSAAAPSAAPVQTAQASAPIAPVMKKKGFSGLGTGLGLGAGKSGRMVQHQEVAIVGLAGRYPQADDLDAFWNNLTQGIDCISEVPADRWDHSKFFDPRRDQLGKTYSKWGGFINDVDKFDPLFFNISPKEAELVDPQERLFLETVWHAIEDAGYSKESIYGGRVGVYVGVMWGQYELYGAEAMLAGNASVPNSSYASVANRISYFFNFSGPSMALDTMCSSSLTAIHLATEALSKGDIDAAIAGGVNISIHPHKYVNLAQGNFQASDGRCRSFGEGGDGYVPGEGVGAVLLKPLDQALLDGDHVYALVRSTAINHGGKTNGYTVPNPVAQGDLVLEALNKGNVDPKTLSYLETHGTGTSLGDPIEITGLNRAFEEFNPEKQFCPIGSVKSNIGHLESAAGIAAISKVLLQLKHNKLVPSLHADTLNPNIDFENSPFYVQTKLADWQRKDNQPRRVGVSSFGAGGSNAHIILEEYIDSRQSAPAINNTLNHSVPEVFVLSARDLNTLVKYAEKYLAFIDGLQSAEDGKDGSDISLAELAYTSQVGRSPLHERLLILANDMSELRDKLQQWLELPKGKEASKDTRKESKSNQVEGIFHGNNKDAKANTGGLIVGEAGEAYLKVIQEKQDLPKIAKLWVSGIDFDWSFIQRQQKLKRVSLPTYPFAKERYWINDHLGSVVASFGGRVEQGANAQAQSQTQGLSQGIRPAPVAVPKQQVFYTPKWDIAKLAKSSAEVSGTTLVFSAGIELSTALQKAHAHSDVVWVEAGDAYKAIDGGHFVANLNSEESLQQLIDGLAENDRLPTQVVHHLNASAGSVNGQIDGQVDGHLNSGFYALFNLCRALMKHKSKQALKLISVQTTDALTDEQSTINATFNTIFGQALAGFFKTLGLEKPNYMAKVLSLPTTEIVEHAQVIADELQAEQWRDKEVRYVNKGESLSREVKRYVVYNTSELPMAELPLKQRGVYLVSGGLGGLGYIIAEYLVKQYQARLVLFGRSEPKAEQQAKIQQLQDLGSEVLYVQADASNLSDMQKVVSEAKAKFSAVNGVIHSAGVNKDAFIIKKTPEEMASVLAPKVLGGLNLDAATKDEDLDLFVMFSSVAGAMGNLGQCDYAYGNHFLDALAQARQSLTDVTADKPLRTGISLSINWPFWAQGGMSISENDVAITEQQTGMAPLPTEIGIASFETLLRSGLVQGVPLYGNVNRIAAYVAPETAVLEAQPVSATTPAATATTVTRTVSFNAEALQERTEEYLKELLSEEIKLPVDRISSDERFESYGIDSVMVGRFNANLERDLGELSKTLLYEYDTIEELAEFLIQEVEETLLNLFKIEATVEEVVQQPIQVQTQAPVYAPEPVVAAAQAAEPVVSAPAQEYIPAPVQNQFNDKIAIVGVHGLYPQSNDLNEYWQNLAQGKDLVEVIPPVRWDAEAMYDNSDDAAQNGKIYCKWGAFVDDFDKFDPGFFNISPNEAKTMDPQERLFISSVWSAIEDAGYTKEQMISLFPKAGSKSADVGVYVGITTNSYNMLTADEWARGNLSASPSSLPWSIANRVSYFFDFQGPSLPVDTACSSSLVALHMACEAIKRNECQAAIAGGVNLYLHPGKYHSLCAKGMLSNDGMCNSFGVGDDGFVPGEGVGTMLLMPLSVAEANGSHIYGTVAGSAFEHAGRSNGYSAPNPNAQAIVIANALKNANVHPETVNYIEGHGTGTGLGDSMEITALNKAFEEFTDKKQFCPIGSVKANLGHSEAAAGVTGIAKILLQMQHKQIAPSIHAEEINPNINFADSPFYLQRELADWNVAEGQPRRAMINSFGAGGVNACVIIDEYIATTQKSQLPEVDFHLFVLSAKNEERLRDYANKMAVFVGQHPELNLTELVYTSQVGREAMAERLAIVVSSLDELKDKLTQWLQQRPTSNLFRATAQTKRGRKAKAVDEALEAMYGEQDLFGIAEKWIAGSDIEWARMYSVVPQRISLPTYPFAKERYWIGDTPAQAVASAETGTAKLHPLVSHNSSTLKSISFTSTLSDKAFYAEDHQVNNEKIFPGAGYVEMACIAGNIAGEQRVAKVTDIVWAAPVSFATGEQTLQTELKPVGDAVEYMVTSLDEDYEKVVHSEGRLYFESDVDVSAELNKAMNKKVPLKALRDQCPMQRNGAYYYKTFAEFGFGYGPGFQTIQEFYGNQNYAITKLKVDDSLMNDFEQFILHPSLIDGALQTVVGLIGSVQPGTPYLPFALDEVLILRPLTQTCYAHVEFAEPGQVDSPMKKFNIQLLNERGEVLAKLKNFYVRALVTAPKSEAVES
ncbi:SDR family NAD(P)-dependent oxidoreductase [Paraneptunicella aestuarii]|uniref:SDR family NAD(P)-dependent oxidoreductase n=1 Tax=Paraneptunicella aestuarii TaxID=2831148 RepID=UPI001E439BAB|nr:SDR family NAD(P)-dependent oxidoreductase [Paraneptunicella aestuarii]UAA37463.1 SDR family NAD(P)-dependent oxidoreductase [Paraneptunicella aestuarii]